ncbi:MAG: TonB-dependent receptor [Methylohalobius sp. ZOD2]
MPPHKFLPLLLVASASFAHQPSVELTPLTVTAAPEQGSGRTVLNKEVFQRQLRRTLGETLEQLPGFNNQSFGPGVGLPVIRGQSGPRVRILQNSLGVNDLSSVSPDHAIGMEPLFADRIEVLHGPATLRYGSGIVGGLVNVLDNRIPENLPDRAVEGTGEYRYDSPSDEHAGSARLDAGGGPFAFHLEGLRRTHGDLDTGSGVLDGTDGDAISGSAGISWVGEAGFIGASINHLKNTYGVPTFPHHHDAPHDEPHHEEDDHAGEKVYIDLKQTRHDLRAALYAPFPWAEEVRLGFGHTDYRHVEIEGDERGTLWTRQAYESRLELTHSPIGPVTGSVGFQSRHGDLAAIGEEAIVPRTDTENYALFINERLQQGSFLYELGARVEHQRTDAENRRLRRDLPVSGAASVTWQASDRHRFSLAFTSTQRAPQVQELYSFGVHHASQSFEVGNPNLDREHSHQLELGYRFESSLVTAEINLFHYWIDDYIFFRNTGRIDAASELPIFNATQQDAIFKGFDAQLHFPLLATRRGDLDLILFGDYTRGRLTGGGDVPRMPPLRYGFEFKFHRDEGNAFLRLTRAEAQDHPGRLEAPTPSYVVLNIGGEYRIPTGDRTQVTVFAQGTNLLNQTVRNATSFLRTIAPEPGRGARAGIRIGF